MATKGMAWVRILVGAVWLNGALEKLFNPHFPQQFAQSLDAGGSSRKHPRSLGPSWRGSWRPTPKRSPRSCVSWSSR